MRKTEGKARNPSFKPSSRSFGSESQNFRCQSGSFRSETLSFSFKNPSSKPNFGPSGRTSSLRIQKSDLRIEKPGLRSPKPLRGSPNVPASTLKAACRFFSRRFESLRHGFKPVRICFESVRRPFLCTSLRFDPKRPHNSRRASTVVTNLTK
jgi:hypothetical protein